MGNEQSETTMRTRDVCVLLGISTNTLYKKLRDPKHPLTRAQIKGLKPYRFKRIEILAYAGVNEG